jgi:lipopolysaccharide biosynthesis protein/predicted O-methyltransferase YrrM
MMTQSLETFLAAAEFTPRSLQNPLSWAGHLPFAAWLARRVAPAIFVELGTHTGNSYFAFCQAVAQAGLPTRCYAVDTWQGDEQAGAYGEDVFQQVDAHNRQHYGEFSSLLRMTFDEAVDSFSDGSVDLLHIDGLHTYEAVRHDFETWLPKLSPGATVIFHDTNVREKGFGVWKFWEELKQHYPHHFEFTHSHGLGVLQLGDDEAQEGLAPLMAAPEQRQQIRQYFALLGARILEREQASRDMEELRQGIAEHHRILTEREERITRQKQQIEELRQGIAEHREILTEREERIFQLDRKIEELQEARAMRETRISTLEQSTAELDRDLAAVTGNLTTAHQLIAELQSSTSWRITAPLRQLSTLARGGLRGLQKTRDFNGAVRAHGGPVMAARKAFRVWRREGLAGVRARWRRVPQPLSPPAVSQALPPNPPAEAASTLQVVPRYIDPRCDQQPPQLTADPTIAIHLHLFYPDMRDEFVTRLAAMPCAFDLFLSVPQNWKGEQDLTAELQSSLPRVRQIIIEPVPNRGRDIAPFIIQFGQRLARYDVIAHFHSKKSPHCDQLAGWCKDLLDLLIGPPHGSGGRLARILNLLLDDAKLVYPEGQPRIIKDRTGWGGNYPLAKELLEKHTDLDIADYPVVEFPEGSMFWARGESMAELLHLPLRWEDFPAEPIPADGTLAHALERLLLIVPSARPGRFYRLHSGDSIHDYRHYEEQRDFSQTRRHHDVKVLSYYLPQFHPIPENDRWHGKGFTEWTKVRAANPLFEGHYQQHIPHTDLGCYLLDHPGVLRKQAEMMRKAGVDGQVFYHYWFTGKLILEEPARMLLEHPDIEMPFCFCWANENWTRRWDGNEDDILLKQDYSPADARAFIQYLIPFFRDERYIRVDGRPVLFIYRPASMPDARQYLEIWAEECAEQGLPRPYVVSVLTRGAEDPRDFEMDAGVERVLHDWTAGAVADIRHELRPYEPLRGSVLPYEQVAEFYRNQTQAPQFTWFRSLVPIWDNTARYGADAFMVHGSTPRLFQQWLESSIAHARTHLPQDRRFVLVNAWNEWAEGAHLEPDSRYGYAYLNSVGRALSEKPYEADLNPHAPIPAGLRVRISITPEVQAALADDQELESRFLQVLARSTLFTDCSVQVEPDSIAHKLAAHHGRSCAPLGEDADYLLQVRRIALFAPDVIKKMLRTACQVPASGVVSNAYDCHFPLLEATANGSVDSSAAYQAPLLLLPLQGNGQACKNFRVRADAHTFVTYPCARPPGKRPRVSTIIRYHQKGDLGLLKNALYSLSAMQDCLVVPCIAAQDLDPGRTAELEELLAEVPWLRGSAPQVFHYRSPTGSGDLRARMLTETLKTVKTRYAAFLDYDDLLMSHAYGALLERLHRTGKAVAFGRVYSTDYHLDSGLFGERRQEFTHGFSYDDYLATNHAPLHSFLLDLRQLDLSGLTFVDDQRYLEDYYLTLQLFTRDNADWQGLADSSFIGDYIHAIGSDNTLAFADADQRRTIVEGDQYRRCEKRVRELKAALEGS